MYYLYHTFVFRHIVAYNNVKSKHIAFKLSWTSHTESVSHWDKSYGVKTRQGRPVDNKPSTDYATNLSRYFFSFFFLCDMLYLTHAMWHMTLNSRYPTHDTWHATHDTHGMVNIVLKLQVPSSNSLGVMMSCDMQHAIYETWHVWCDIWLVTCNTLNQWMNCLCL